MFGNVTFQSRSKHSTTLIIFTGVSWTIQHISQCILKKMFAISNDSISIIITSKCTKNSFDKDVSCISGISKVHIQHLKPIWLLDFKKPAVLLPPFYSGCKWTTVILFYSYLLIWKSDLLWCFLALGCYFLCWCIWLYFHLYDQIYTLRSINIHNLELRYRPHKSWYPFCCSWVMVCIRAHSSQTWQCRLP